jgi:hypothetical protein
VQCHILRTFEEKKNFFSKIFCLNFKMMSYWDHVEIFHKLSVSYLILSLRLEMKTRKGGVKVGNMARGNM